MLCGDCDCVCNAGADGGFAVKTSHVLHRCLLIFRIKIRKERAESPAACV